MIYDKNGNKITILDKMFEERTLFIIGAITDETANYIVPSLLLFAKQSNDPIKLFINSPGGEINAGLAICNTMDLIKAPIHTYGYGMCASMASFILAKGEKGHRHILQDTVVMIHQPLGGAQGQQTEIEIAYQRITSLRERLEKEYAKITGKTVEEIHKACDRDNYLVGEDAVKFGLVDTILK